MSAYNAGDLGSIPGSGRSSGEGNGKPLQYSCLENPMDRGAWCAAVPGVAKSRARLSDFIFAFHFHTLEKEMATHSSTLAGKPHGQRSLVGYSPWDHKESDTTEHIHFHFYLLHFCFYCSVCKSYPALCYPMNYSMSGSSGLHYLLKFSQIYVC